MLPATTKFKIAILRIKFTDLDVFRKVPFAENACTTYEVSIGSKFMITDKGFCATNRPNTRFLIQDSKSVFRIFVFTVHPIYSYGNLIMLEFDVTVSSSAKVSDEQSEDFYYQLSGLLSEANYWWIIETIAMQWISWN